MKDKSFVELLQTLNQCENHKDFTWAHQAILILAKEIEEIKKKIDIILPKEPQVCRFCLNPDSILTPTTCCTGCSKLDIIPLKPE